MPGSFTMKNDVIRFFAVALVSAVRTGKLTRHPYARSNVWLLFKLIHGGIHLACQLVRAYIMGGIRSLGPRPTLQHWMYVSHHQHAQEGLVHSGTLLVVSLFWIVRFSCSVNSIVVTIQLCSWLGMVTTILRKNRTIQNKLTTRSVRTRPCVLVMRNIIQCCKVGLGPRLVGGGGGELFQVNSASFD